MTAMQSIEGVICVRLDFTIWAGRKKLRSEDLKKISGDQIPPADLASLGSKKICDPADLRIFAALKRRAERSCLKVGVKFLGGYAIPEGHIKEVMGELKAIEDEFEIAKQNFLHNYGNNIDEWIQSHKDWEQIIRSAVEPVDKIKEKLLYGFQAYRVNVASDIDADLNLGLKTQAEGLGDRLFFEVSQMASTAWEDSYKGKDKVTQKGLWSINKILDKLKALSFIDVRVGPVVAHIEQVIAGLPKSGAIEGANFSSVVGLLLLLSNTDRMKDHGQQYLNNLQHAGDDDDLLDSMIDEDSELDEAEVNAAATEDDELVNEPDEPEAFEQSDTDDESVSQEVGSVPPQQDQPAPIAWF